MVGFRGYFANFVRGNGPMVVVGRACMFNNNRQGTLVMEEKFETIKGFGAKYIVSNFGRVFSNNGKELKPGTNNCGYKYIKWIFIGKQRKNFAYEVFWGK